jgi:hypothetical protein
MYLQTILTVGFKRKRAFMWRWDGRHLHGEVCRPLSDESGAEMKGRGVAVGGGRWAVGGVRQQLAVLGLRVGRVSRVLFHCSPFCWLDG